MLLTGTYERSLDEKLRVAVPKPLRQGIGDPDHCVIYVAPGLDRSLSLYPEESFSSISLKFENSAFTEQDVRRYSRMFFSQTERCEVDKQGRIRIPPELAKHGSISKEVVMIGVRDHIELWNKELWEDYFGVGKEEYDKIAESAMGQPNEKSQNQPINITQTQQNEGVKPR